ncbi:hypothetical protein EMIT0324P_20556 [Pseudomonas chlororaphis]
MICTENTCRMPTCGGSVFNQRRHISIPAVTAAYGFALTAGDTVIWFLVQFINMGNRTVQSHR